MKQVGFLSAIVVALCLAPTVKVSAQAEIIQEIIKEAIMEVDLGVQKIQEQTVYLQDAQKAIENAMQQLHLNDITDWVQKQKDLYGSYYQELWQIKDALTYYQRVKDIISKQVQLVNDYKAASAQIKQDAHFSVDELSHIQKVYDGILSQSVANINLIALVINAFVTQMDDADRLRILNTASEKIDKNYSDLRVFSQQNILLSLQRSKDQGEVDMVKQLYGL